MDKPLHVQVAEALGWFGFEPSINGMWPDEWRGHEPVPIIGEHVKLVPRYDTDWSATGPLIEQYKIAIGEPDAPELRAALGEWYAIHSDSEEGAEYGPTPLIAVCNLILALAAAGTLDAHQPSPFTASPPTA